MATALVAGAAFAIAASIPGSAEAAPRNKSKSAASAKRDVTIKNPFGDIPKGPIQIVVSIADQRLTLYSNGVQIVQTPVSTGTPGHPTPTGVFSVIQKNRWHRSNLYHNAPMHFMQRLTWSGVAMHEGLLPGYPASHGCIRMPSDFAARLWRLTRLGARVIVARHDVMPQEFDHPKLFVVKEKPGQPPVAEAEAEKRAATEPPIQVAWAMAMNGSDGISDAPPEPALRKSLTDTLPPAKPAGAEPVDATEAAPAAAPVAPTEQASDAGAVEDAKPADTGNVGTSATVLAPASKAAEEVPGPDKPAANDEVPLPKPVPTTTRAAEPRKLSGQIAVFVSRKEKKVFVRQGFMPLFEMPVEIVNPDQPLGTHVFTAMEFRDSGRHLRWNAMTMPAAAPQAAERPGTGNSKKSAKALHKKAPTKLAVRPAGEMKPPSTAAEALDRIQIPQDALDRIGELVTPGASLVISDQGLGRETGLYTEFIVLTR